MKRKPRFYKPVFKYPLGNSLPRIYSGSLRNGDITLKSFSSKCSNHSKQINKAAFLDSFVARGRKPQRLPALPGSEACFASLLFAAPLGTGRQTVQQFVAGKFSNFTWAVMDPVSFIPVVGEMPLFTLGSQ